MDKILAAATLVATARRARAALAPLPDDLVPADEAAVRIQDAVHDLLAVSSRPAACCISDRANGIPGNRCRDGRTPVTGAPTGSRSGTIRNGWPIPRAIMASAPMPRASSPKNWRARLAVGSRTPGDRLRGSARIHSQGARPAGECRPGEQQARQSGRSRTPAPRLLARPQPAGRVRAAAAARPKTDSGRPACGCCAGSICS